MKPIHFYDAATPENVPSGVHAAVYINGFAWSKQEQDRMSAIFSISVHPDEFYARFASCIDIENGAANPQDAVPFVQERRRMFGPHDAKCYVNRSNWQTVKDHFTEAKVSEPLWWVATLDGTQEVEGAWAVQYFGGEHTAFDLSVLHGRYSFHKP